MRRYFLTGFAIFLPISLCLALLQFFIHLITAPFFSFISPYITKIAMVEKSPFFFLQHELLRHFVINCLIFIIILLFTISIGWLTHWVLFKTCMKIGETLLRRIPLVNSIYKMIRDLTKTFFSTDSQAFQKVVIVPFPGHGLYTLGFVTSSAPDKLQQENQDNSLSVLVPTAPLPMSGFLLKVPKEQVIFVNMARDQAIKYIISCGIIPPSSPPLPASS